MNNWSLLLLVCLAVIQPITAEHNLVDGRDQSCDPLGYRLAYGHRSKTEDRRISRNHRDQRNEVRSLLSRPLIDERIGVSIRSPVSSERQVAGFRRETTLRSKQSYIRPEAEIRQDLLANRRENSIHGAREKQDRDHIQEHYARNSARKNVKENLIRSTRTIHANRDRPIAGQGSARSYEIRQGDRRDNDFNTEERSRQQIRERIARSTVRQDDRTYERREQRNSMDAHRATTGHRDVAEREQVQKTRQTRSVFQRERQDVAQRSVPDQIRGRDSRPFEIRHSSGEQRMLGHIAYREIMQRRAVDQARNIKHEVRRRRSLASLGVARDEFLSPVDNDRKVTHLSRSRPVADRIDARDETRPSLGQVRNVHVDVSISRQAAVVEQVWDTREIRKSSVQVHNLRNIALSGSASHHVRVARDETRRSVDRFCNSREVQNSRDESRQRQSLEQFRNVAHLTDIVRVSRDFSRRFQEQDCVVWHESHSRSATGRDARDNSRRSQEQVPNVRDTAHSRIATDRDDGHNSRRSLKQVRNERDTVHSRIATDRDGRDNSRRSEQVRNVRDTVHSRIATDRDDRDNSRRFLKQDRNERDTVHSRKATDRDARDNSRRSQEQVRNVRDTVHSRIATDRNDRVDSRRSREQSRNVRGESHTRSATDRFRDVREDSRKSREQVRMTRDVVLSRAAFDKVDNRNVRDRVREVRNEPRRFFGRIRNNVRDKLQVLTPPVGQERVRDRNDERERLSTISMQLNQMQSRERASKDSTMMLRSSFEGTRVERRLARESQRVRNADANVRVRETQDHVQRTAEVRNRERIMERPEKKQYFRNIARNAKERQHLDVTREMKVFPIRADYRIANNLERSLDSRFTVNTQVRDIRKDVVSLIREEPQQKLDTMTWHHILYALQGIYLCGMIIQLLSFDSDKKKSRALWWVLRFDKLLKVD